MRSRGAPTRSVPNAGIPYQQNGTNHHGHHSYTHPPGYSNPAVAPQAAQMNGAHVTTTPPQPAPSSHTVSQSEPFEGWLPLFLLAIALYSVVATIITAQWVEQSILLLWMPIAGLLVGLGIAKIPRFPQSILHLTACLVGFWLAVWLTSALAFHLPWQQVIEFLLAALEGRMASLEDPQGSQIIFFFYLAFLCFFLGYFGSWLVYRARLPWLVGLVYSSIMLVNVNYVSGPATLPILVIMLAALLLLVARMHLVGQIAQWKLEGLYTDRNWLRAITTRCTQVACGITLLTVLCASALPAFTQPASGQLFWLRTETAWNNLLNGRFAWEDLNNLSPFASSTQNFFSDRLTITGSVTLPQGEVLSYSGERPYYLAGFTYNRFDGHTWSTTVTRPQRYSANDMLTIDNTDTRNGTGEVKVTLTQPPGGTRAYVFAPEQPRRFSRPVTMYIDWTPGAWAVEQPLRAGESYDVEFVRPASDPEELSTVPLPTQDVNAWKQDRNFPDLENPYLQVPDDLSDTVAKTLTDWTRGADNAYEGLKMLENRFNNSREFTYSLQNPPVPPDMDVVDWLLKNKQGYCTHYATAMAVMGRMLDIPTRIVNGFSNGKFDAQRNAWVVQGTDAHSWVQAYFPNYGWVSFDPTPGFAQNAAPSPGDTAPSLPGSTPTTQPTQPQVTPTTPPQPDITPTAQPATPGNPNGQNGGGDNYTLWMGISIGAIFLSLLFCLFALVRYWWRNLYTQSTFVAGLYWRFCKLASFVGMAPKSWQTPYEYSRNLGQQFPSQARSLWQLTDLFVRERWGSPRHRPHESEIANVRQHWRSLRGLFLRLLVRRIKRKSS